MTDFPKHRNKNIHKGKYLFLVFQKIVALYVGSSSSDDTTTGLCEAPSDPP